MIARDLATLVLGYVQALIWPAVVLTTVLLFRAPLRGALSRLQRADFPGGVSLNFQQEIELASVLAREVAGQVEHIPHEILDGSAAQARMLALGLQPSPSALDFTVYDNLVAQDPQVALAGVRIELEIMLSNLARSSSATPAEPDPAALIVQALRESGALTRAQAQLIQHILRLCTIALHGQTVSPEQALAILDAASVVRDYYQVWLTKRGG